MSNLTKDEIERLTFEYSPSMNTKRYENKEDAIKGHVEFVETETKRVREELDLKVEYNVNYGGADDEVLDIYCTKECPEDAPLFVYVHGGYWQILSKDDSAYCVAPLVAVGYRVLVVNYTLCPKLTLEQLVAQIQKCIKFCDNYVAEHQSRHVSYCGHSAGAHLILAAFSDQDFWSTIENEKIKCLYLISGVYDLREVRHVPSVNGNNILSITDANVTRLSPILQTFSHLKDKKTQLYVGEHESKTFKSLTNDMHNRLATNFGVDSTVEVITNMDHFNIVENLSRTDFVITKAIVNNF